MFFSHKYKSLDQVADGSTVAIPNDPTNGARALLLLQQAKLITLKDGKTVDATVADIVSNPKIWRLRNSMRLKSLVLSMIWT